MNIRDFLAQINNGGISYTSEFYVQLFPPESFDMDLERLTFRIESASLPGRGVNSVDFSLNGLAQKIPNGSSVGEIELSVILSEDRREKLFFEQWLDKIIGNYRVNNEKQNYKIGYYKEIIGSCNIIQLDVNGNESYRAELKEVYPLTLGNVEASWENKNIAKLSVTLAYKYYTDSKS